MKVGPGAPGCGQNAISLELTGAREYEGGARFDSEGSVGSEESGKTSGNALSARDPGIFAPLSNNCVLALRKGLRSVVARGGALRQSWRVNHPVCDAQRLCLTELTSSCHEFCYTISVSLRCVLCRSGNTEEGYVYDQSNPFAR